MKQTKENLTYCNIIHEHCPGWLACAMAAVCCGLPKGFTDELIARFHPLSFIPETRCTDDDAFHDACEKFLRHLRYVKLKFLAAGEKIVTPNDAWERLLSGAFGEDNGESVLQECLKELGKISFFSRIDLNRKEVVRLGKPARKAKSGESTDAAQITLDDKIATILNEDSNNDNEPADDANEYVSLDEYDGGGNTTKRKLSLTDRQAIEEFKEEQRQEAYKESIRLLLHELAGHSVHKAVAVIVHFFGAKHKESRWRLSSRNPQRFVIR